MIRKRVTLTACRIHGNGTLPHAGECSDRDMLFTVKDETIILNDLNDKMAENIAQRNRNARLRQTSP